MLNENNKGFIVVCIFFTLLMIVDLYTTLRIGEYATYLEANPIFKHVGFIGIVIVNFLYVFVLIWMYNRAKATVTLRFMLIFIVLSMCLLRGAVIINNIDVAQQIKESGITIEEVSEIPREQVEQQYQDFLLRNLLNILLPFLIASISFMAFKKDHHIERIGKWKASQKQLKNLDG